MKKYYNILVSVSGLLLCPTLSAQEVAGTTEPCRNDSIILLGYRTVSVQDMPGGVSVINPAEFLDKLYSTYSLDGASSIVAGSNLRGLGNYLVLVDGVARSANDVTPGEIEQITYLKSANAVALYGSRGANGAILITTKRGRAGENRVNVRGHAGIHTPKSYPQYIGSAEYMTYYNQACENDGLSPIYSKSQIYEYVAQNNPYRYPDVNYYSSDYLRNHYNSYSVQADFTGGTKRLNFFALAGVQNNNTQLNVGEGKKEGSTRFNIRGNVDLHLNDFIKTYVNVNTVFSNSHYAHGDFWNQATKIHPNRYSPLVPISYINPENESLMATAFNGTRLIDGKYLLGGSQEYMTNPIASALVGGYYATVSRQFQFTGGLDIDLNRVVKGLSLHGALSIDYSNSYAESVDNEYAVYVAEWLTDADGNDYIAGLTKHNKDRNPGTQNLSATWNQQTIDFNVHLDYANKFSDIHSLNAMLLATASSQKQTGDYQYDTNSNLGLLVDYNYSGRYYVSLVGSVVNSTRLPSANRVAFSPSVELGWRMSEEGFMEDVDFINNLKLTASASILNTDLHFPTTSSGRPKYYMYEDIYTSSPAYGWHDGKYSNYYTSITQGANRNLDYVKRKEVNIGIDGNFFNSELLLNANVFYGRIDGIPVIASTAFPGYFTSYYPATSLIPYTNFNANRYQGLEFQVNYTKSFRKVYVAAGVIGSYQTTKALKRDELYVDTYRNRCGKPTDAIFGLQSDGLFQSQKEIDERGIEQKFGEVKPGDIKYKDQNNDGVIDERDEVMIGRWGAPFSYGVNLTFGWNNFTLFVMGTGNVGGTGIKSSDYYWINGDKKYSVTVRDTWTKNNPDAAYPRLTTLSGNNNFRTSDFWAYSTDRFDLTKVQLTYSLPQRLLRGSVIKDAKVFVNGCSLLTIAPHRDVLELSLGYPQCRSYNFGLSVKF